MELNEYRRCIVQPIAGDNPTGERLVDDPLFDFIEEQLMKVGSLSHASVQWEEVEHSIVKLLSEKTKDIKLLVYLLQCLHNQITPARFIVSFGIMSDFMRHFWGSSYPAPGNRGNLPRRKFFSQIIQRFMLVTEKIDFSHFDNENRQLLAEAISVWQQVIVQHELNSEAVTSVVRLIQGQLSKAEEQQKQVDNVTENKRNEQSSRRASGSEAVFDHSSDKATRQTLLKVADFLAEQEFGIGLSIRLRRYAVWGSILSAPDHDSRGETLLRGMLPDRIKDYQDQLRQPALNLWRKLEHSLTMAPYWFEGHRLSYMLAFELGKQEWCDAILCETRQFLNRLPILHDLKFKGGEAFVPDNVKNWLSTESVSATTGSVGSDWHEKRSEALSLAKEAGIAVALSMLNDGLVQAREPRDKFYWRLLSADLMQASRLDAMAKTQYQTLYEQITSMHVTQWEPSLLEQLARHTTSE